MRPNILYRSKSFTHKFLFYGLLWGILVSSLAALPFLLIYGVQNITAYVMLKGVLIMFSALYVYYFTRVFNFTERGVEHCWRYRNNKPIRSVGWDSVQSAGFMRRPYSLIGRLHLILDDGTEIRVILPEDHIADVRRILSQYSVAWQGFLNYSQ
jgi:hypothetical protein